MNCPRRREPYSSLSGRSSYPRRMYRALVVLDLEISVSEPQLADFLAFLRRAVPFYEEPGGIRVTLLRDDQRPGRYI